VTDRLASEGGRPVRTAFLPFARPTFGQEERQAVLQVLDSGWLTLGPRVEQFEAALAAYLGVPHVVCVDSCTAALHLSLLALGVSPGQEVITSPLTFCSTVNVILHAGGRPVLADVERDTLNLDPVTAEAAITARTRALLPVHYGGQPCLMDVLTALARARGVAVIEDAAHGIGAVYRDRKVGTWGDVGCFSFYATKNLTTGEGGALATRHSDLAARARLLGLHGMDRDAWKRYTAQGSWYYEVQAAGFKYNMSDLEAAIGLGQLHRLEAMNARRLEIARAYDAALAHHPALEIPVAQTGAASVYHLYPLRLRLEALSIDRARFMAELGAENIGASVHFIPIHFHPFYQETLGVGPGSFPVAEAAYPRLISLPIYPAMTDTDVHDTITAVLKIAEHFRR
jgi:dTDP-4-amino-4,6-dideoxygalactose transaminase